MGVVHTEKSGARHFFDVPCLCFDRTHWSKNLAPIKNRSLKPFEAVVIDGTGCVGIYIIRYRAFREGYNIIRVLTPHVR